MKPKVCFVTVCGGGEDYEYLLGSIEHHATLGEHVVLDTSPDGQGRYFRNLPSSVHWTWDPRYGAGWEEFRFVDALNEAIRLAELLDPAVIIQLDSDDFFTPNFEAILPTAARHVVELQYVHWLSDGRAYLYGESEWHRRVWPGGRQVRFCRSRSWPKHQKYNGNPDAHPELDIPEKLEVVRSGLLCRHHVHYAIGEKAKDTMIAEQSITGWPHGRMEVGPVPWPRRLTSWRGEGVKPSEAFR